MLCGHLAGDLRTKPTARGNGSEIGGDLFRGEGRLKPWGRFEYARELGREVLALEHDLHALDDLVLREYGMPVERAMISEVIRVAWPKLPREGRREIAVRPFEASGLQKASLHATEIPIGSDRELPDVVHDEVPELLRHQREAAVAHVVGVAGANCPRCADVVVVEELGLPLGRVEDAAVPLKHERELGLDVAHGPAVVELACLTLVGEVDAREHASARDRQKLRLVSVEQHVAERRLTQAIVDDALGDLVGSGFNEEKSNAGQVEHGSGFQSGMGETLLLDEQSPALPLGRDAVS